MLSFLQDVKDVTVTVLPLPLPIPLHLLLQYKYISFFGSRSVCTFQVSCLPTLIIAMRSSSFSVPLSLSQSEMSCLTSWLPLPCKCCSFRFRDIMFIFSRTFTGNKVRRPRRQQRSVCAMCVCVSLLGIKWLSIYRLPPKAKPSTYPPLFTPRPTPHFRSIATFAVCKHLWQPS